MSNDSNGSSDSDFFGFGEAKKPFGDGKPNFISAHIINHEIFAHQQPNSIEGYLSLTSC